MVKNKVLELDGPRVNLALPLTSYVAGLGPVA